MKISVLAVAFVALASAIPQQSTTVSKAVTTTSKSGSSTLRSTSSKSSTLASTTSRSIKSSSKGTSTTTSKSSSTTPSSTTSKSKSSTSSKKTSSTTQKPSSTSSSHSTSTTTSKSSSTSGTSRSSTSSTSTSSTSTSSTSSSSTSSSSTSSSSTSSSTTTSSLPAGPTNKLVPILDPNTNTSDVSSLIPQDSSALYYAEESYMSNPYLKMLVKMDVNFTYPTVLIENTDLLDDFSCAFNPAANGQTNLLIASQAAYDIIKNYWMPLSQMVLIINGAACYDYVLPNPTAGSGTNNTRQYWLGHVSFLSASFLGENSTFLKFTGDEIALEQGITEGYLQWGSTGGPTTTSRTAPSPTATLNNTQLCSQKYVPPQGGLPAADPCSDDFDQSLDQAAGIVYVPANARHTNLALAMQGALAHPQAASLYLASVSYTAPQRRKRTVETASATQTTAHEPGLTQITAAPVLQERGLTWGDIANAFEDAGQHIVDGLETLTADGKSAVNAFSADVSAFEASATSALGAMASAVVSFVDNAGTAIKSEFEEVAGEVAALTENLSHVIENTAEEFTNDLGTFGPQGSGNININLAPDAKADSPWGKAYQIYKYPKSKDKRDSQNSTTSTSTSTGTSHSSTSSTSSSSSASATPSSNVDKSFTAYCVGCGLSGTVAYTGAARFSVADGVQELTFAMQGPLQFTIGLGLDAEVVYTMPTYTLPLLPAQGLPIPILEIEGILVIGPVVELDATLDLTMTAEGRAIAGTTVGIPEFNSYFDFVNTANSYVKGFDSPTISKYFAAAGQIGATATVGMPFSVGVGIDIIPLKFDKQIKLVNTPSITANAAFEAQFSTGSGAPSGPNVTCPNGFSWDITYADELDLNIFDLYTDPLYTYNSPPIASGCYQIPGTSGQDKRHLAPRQSNTTTSDGPYPSNFPVSNYTYDPTHGGMQSSNNIVSDASTSYASYGTQLTVYPTTNGTLSVVSSGGNLYVQTASTGTQFQIIRDVGSDWTSAQLQYSYATSISLVTDDQDRAFYLFADTLASSGISRVRMYGVNEAPSNAFQTVFGHGDLTGSSTVRLNGPYGAYFFSDPNNPLTAYHPVACLVTNAANEQYTQIFATSDVKDAIQALEDNPSTFTAQIVGGIVHSCSYLQLTGTYNAPTNGDSAVDQANAIVQAKGLPPLFPPFAPVDHGQKVCMVNGIPKPCPPSPS